MPDDPRKFSTGELAVNGKCINDLLKTHNGAGYFAVKAAIYSDEKNATCYTIDAKLIIRRA
jgi:hypothetical protein